MYYFLQLILEKEKNFNINKRKNWFYCGNFIKEKINYKEVLDFNLHHIQ